MIQAYLGYSKIAYDVTSGHMTLRFDKFGGKLPTGKKETGKFGQGIYIIVQNRQQVYGYKYA